MNEDRSSDQSMSENSPNPRMDELTDLFDNAATLSIEEWRMTEMTMP
jgi:hypothetical protein